MKRLIAVSMLLFISIGNVHALTISPGFESEPNDTDIQANDINPYFAYGIDSDIESGPSGNLANYSATIIGEGGDSTYDYYSFSVGMGDNNLHVGQGLRFDIDYAEDNGIDTWLQLFDTDGVTLLAENDDAQHDGPGDLVLWTLNSFINYTISNPGTYYIAVGEYDGDADSIGSLITDGEYTLHVSAVPIPAAVWLFGSGLLGLIGFSRRKKAA